MRMIKWIVIVSGLTLAAFFIFSHSFSKRGALDAQALETPANAAAEMTGAARSSRAPHYISVRMKKPLETLVAGETGSFELEAYLKTSPGSQENAVQWDHKAEAPLIVWIATPDKSGIEFIDKTNPDRPHRHILVKFPAAPAGASGPLTATVTYTVNARTHAGNHTFWMEIYGQLQNAEGLKFQDLGATRLPFEVDTHLKTKLLMLLVVAAAVFLFNAEWVRVDVVAIAMMVLLPELGLLDSQDTFKGISSNAVMAIIGVMIISYGLNRAGLVSRMTQPLLKYVGKSSRRLTLIFSSMIAVISSVMQNTGAAVLFLPGIRVATSYRLKVPISRVLMPIGMAAILGGTMTMIGTSPLILLNDILPPGMPKFGFLELTPIGVALVVGGLAYLSTLGMRMLARRPESGSDTSNGDAANGTQEGILSSYPNIKGPFEIYVPPDFLPGERPRKVVEIRRSCMVNIVASARSDGSCEIAPLPEANIRPGFVLCAYGPQSAVMDFVEDYGLVLKKEPECFKGNLFNPSLAGIVEGVVSPRSSLIGKTIKEIGFRETFGVNALAIHQSGRTLYRQLADRPLAAG
ncbi:MAG: SLC13 family permease, partial [Desulfosarcinaceae bacterium]